MKLETLWPEAYDIFVLCNEDHTTATEREVMYKALSDMATYIN